MSEIKLKKGDKVVMHTCLESKGKNLGKVWTCQTDSFKCEAGIEVVFLEDFSGFFYTKFLQPVKLDSFVKGKLNKKDMGEADLATIAYMQGAERYKTKWHDLRKDPDDLPLNTDPVLCLGSTGFIVCKYISGSWIDNQTIKLVPKYIDIYKWCEIEDTEE